MAITQCPSCSAEPDRDCVSRSGSDRPPYLRRAVRVAALWPIPRLARRVPRSHRRLLAREVLAAAEPPAPTLPARQAPDPTLAP